MNNTKVVRGQRLTEVLENLKISRSSLSDELKFPSSNLSLILNGQRDIPRSLIDGLSNWKPEINIEWLLTGEGEMLKVLKSEKIDEKTRDEDGPLEAEQTFFSSNLPELMQAFEMRPDTLAPLIKISTHTLTNLMEGSRPPWLSLLLRLRKALGVSIDAMLLWDLREPETMERLKNNLQENQQVQAELQKTMEAILKKITELEEKDKQREKEMAEMRKDIKAK